MVAGLVALLPLAYLVIRIGGTDAGRLFDIVGRPRTWQLIASTLWLTISVSVTAGLLGVVSAVLIVRTRFPGRRGWAIVSALPLAMPSYVAAYTWAVTARGLDGFVGTWMIMSAVTVPLVTLPVAAALRGADPGIEEVARSLGRRPVEAFLRTTMPQVMPAAMAGVLLVALYTVSEYGTPAIMRFDVLTRALVSAYSASFDRSAAFVFALALVAIATLIVVAENASRSRARRWRVGRGAARDVTATPLRPAGAALAIIVLAGPAVVALLVPAITLVQRIVERGGADVDIAQIVVAVRNTVLMSGMGAGLALLLALPVGVLAARWQGRRVRALESASYTGHAMPGVVVGLSLVAATLAIAPALYQTVITVAVAYAVLFLPKAVGSVRTATAAVPPVLEDAARALGRTPFRAWTSVTLRLTAPGVATGGLLALVAAMKELPATLMLRPTGMETLATEMWSRTAVTSYSGAAPYALALVLIAAVPAFLLSGALVSASSLTTATPREPEPEAAP